MKKRILCLLLAMLMAVGAIASLTACGGGGDETVDNKCVDGHTWNSKGKCEVCGERCKQHKDENNDGKCDICTKEMGGEEAYPEVPWINDEKIELYFKMTDNSSGDSCPSGCKRYMAGEDPDYSETLDEDIATRNADAEFFTNTKLKYDYYADVKDFGWGSCHEKIHLEVKSNARGTPDMYCNFAYDMIAASLKQSFANLMGDGSQDQGNFFQFLDEDYDEAVDNRGYMYDYMGSVTLSLTKKYILASDYFTDLIRSFFVVPVNVALLEEIGMEITGDLNKDGKFTIDDFYLDVKDLGWNYDKLATYSNRIYRQKPGSASGEDYEDRLGFILFTGFQSSGLLYSTDITIINKEWSDTKGDYVYSYPKASNDLYNMFDAVSKLTKETGVYIIKAGSGGDPNMSQYGYNNIVATRERFCDNQILFGGIIILGALEYTSYQRLKESSGFGVVPVPLYKATEDLLKPEDVEGTNLVADRYLTTITNGGRCGAIANSTKNFSACTAFLDYQSTHSTDILNSYYTRYLCVSVVDSSVQGTVDMLNYLRENVRSSFDKSFEDALGVYYGVNEELWSYILETRSFDVDIRTEYGKLADNKEKLLQNLYNVYFDLP